MSHLDPWIPGAKKNISASVFNVCTLTDNRLQTTVVQGDKNKPTSSSTEAEAPWTSAHHLWVPAMWAVRSCCCCCLRATSYPPHCKQSSSLGEASGSLVWVGKKRFLQVLIRVNLRSQQKQNECFYFEILQAFRRFFF